MEIKTLKALLLDIKNNLEYAKLRERKKEANSKLSKIFGFA